MPVRVKSDSATSDLDSRSEQLIQQALERLRRDRTVVAIAHRLSTIRNADTILVLEKGRFVESGSHDELLERRGKYADFWKLRSGAESMSSEDSVKEISN